MCGGWGVLHVYFYFLGVFLFTLLSLQKLGRTKWQKDTTSSKSKAIMNGCLLTHLRVALLEHSMGQ